MSFTESLEKKFKLIFERSLIDLESEKFEAPIFKDHIEYIDDASLETYYGKLRNEKKLTLIVRDYIAGMSDKYFNEIYETLIKR